MTDRSDPTLRDGQRSLDAAAPIVSTHVSVSDRASSAVGDGLSRNGTLAPSHLHHPLSESAPDSQSARLELQSAPIIVDKSSAPFLPDRNAPNPNFTYTTTNDPTAPVGVLNPLTESNAFKASAQNPSINVISTVTSSMDQKNRSVGISQRIPPQDPSSTTRQPALMVRAISTTAQPNISIGTASKSSQDFTGPTPFVQGHIQFRQRPPQSQQIPARKLILTDEGRKALTDAVLSSLKNNGQMNPDLLKAAMEITKLSENAILNAAVMARQREEEKKKQNVIAFQQQQQHKKRYDQLEQGRIIHGSTRVTLPGSSGTSPLASHQMVPPVHSLVSSKFPRPIGPTYSSSMMSNTVRLNQPGISTAPISHKKQEATSQVVKTNSDAQAKILASLNEQIQKEIKNWNRLYHGLFMTIPGIAIDNQPKLLQIGGVSRCDDNNAVLGKRKLSSTVKHTEQFWDAISSIQSQVRQNSSFKMINGANTKLSQGPSLLDVTDKYKRIKLQPRKESRQLEKNLRKHRQVTCETIVRKHKDWNKAIVAHSSEFYKFHRQRKFEIGKFARSVRDFVLLQERQKEKSEANEERARIAALRANDMEAYTALVQDTRNDRLKFLLDKTGEYMEEISNMLKGQQHGQVEENDKDSGVELVGGSRVPQLQKETTSYYQSAHVRQEEVKQPSILTFGTLKGYQISGLRWLVSLYNNKLNGILADEMGLGKTVQTIALIAHLMEVKDNRGPYLVIVPLSTLSNWVNEFRRWCPSITVVVYKGTPAQRKGLYKTEVSEGHFNVLLTTYEYIIKDKSSLRKLIWEYAIVDEGHRMKNAQSKFAVTLSTQYETKHRVLLTGTPLQNSLPELWSLLNFLLPSVFNSVETFDQWFNKPFEQFKSSANEPSTEEIINTEERLLIIQRLHELLRPFMLRRIKADVLDQLPDKVEKVIRCELSSWQKELYKQISYKVLEDGQRKSSRGMNNVVMQLRKVCNHPYMFSPEGYYINDDIIRSSGKFELLDRMLPKLKAAGHRILMFFQMTAAMTIMEDYFKHRGILSLRLDGSTPGEERERRMDLFNSPNSPYFVFMLSTRAGGLGLNLVSADTVIIFDSDWNPMMDLQAQDRAHRIGQKKIVSVFRLITNSPVEEKILSRASEKLNMSELVVEAGKFGENGPVKEDQAEERQKIMELLLTDFDSNARGNTTGSLPTSDDEGEDEADAENEEIDLNELLSRNDEDYDFYTKMDSKEIQVDDFYQSPGLAVDYDDIPDWIRYPHGSEDVTRDIDNDGILLDPNKKRSTAKVTSYDDGLTEKQFLRAVEKQAQVDEDTAKIRKAEWKQKRDFIVTETPESSTFEQDFSNLLPKHVVDRLISICKSVIAIRDDKTKRRISDVFREKPSRDEYPQYYQVIQNPIGINDIMRKCKGFEYKSIRSFRSDWSLLFANALQFNGEGSWIVSDSRFLEKELNRLLAKHQLHDEPSPKKVQKPRIRLSLKNLTSKRKKDESVEQDESHMKKKFKN